MRGTPPAALQIAAENFPPGDVARSAKVASFRKMDNVHQTQS